ncbi:myosin-4 [Monosporozyma servazzii]
MTFDIGTRCWFPSKEYGWVGAEIVKVDSATSEATLKLENGEEVAINLNKMRETTNDSIPGLALRNPPILEATEDLTSLSYLNEPAVLHAIKERFANKNIYTYSGIVLIATNPFAKVDELYGPNKVHDYSTKRKEDLQPHLFAIADAAYKQMQRDGENQTIIVSGESGAGKTVSAKYIMRYYASVQDETSHSHEMSEIEHRILATNPIMEAFGNAKTTRNDNSSRFGKYLSISFNKENKILGAQIKTYLLERSRLVFQPAQERNYHIFYQLLQGLTSEQKTALHLTTSEDYFYMNQGYAMIIPDVNDKQEFDITTKALDMIGINEDIQSHIFQILSGILHIGNIEIKKMRNDASVSSTDESLTIACDLLGIDSFNFAKWITKKQIVTRSENIVSNLNFNQAIVVRDSVAKFIYSALFDWLVDTINNKLNESVDQNAINSFIGVLDIYGFEHFEKNSFEQFCINYANEKLQQEFNHHVFKLEQEEYIKEEIEWSFIEFNDNQPCIDLIENKLGILSLLDEESRLPSGSDESWTQKLYQTFDKEPTNKVFNKPRFGQTKFIVSHYAHDVSYDVDGFIEKNRDTVPDTHLEVLKASTNKTLISLLDNLQRTQESMEAKKQEEMANRPGPRRMIQKKPTLGSLFKGSLTELMTTINSTNVHYIRCIKPNPDKEAWKFDNLMVLSQLRACGVLETIKISCAGFPSRWTFDEFIQRYYFLVPVTTWNQYLHNENSDILQLVKNILDITIEDKDTYQIGKTKIFFRAGMLAYLENLRSAELARIVIKIQKKVRGRYYRQQYLATVESIRCTQRYIRGELIRKRVEYELQERAAVMIQSIIRTKNIQRYWSEVHKSTVLIQSHVRRVLTQRYVINEQKKRASTLIQSNVRGFFQRSNYHRTKQSVIVVQSHLRRKMAQIEYANLKENMSFSNSDEARLVVEFVDFIKEIGSKIKQNKSNYDDVKILEKNDSIVDNLVNDPIYQDLETEFNRITDLLRKNYSEIKTLREHHIQWQNKVKSQLKSLHSKDIHTKSENMNVLYEKMKYLSTELELIISLEETPAFKVSTQQQEDVSQNTVAIGLGIFSKQNSINSSSKENTNNELKNLLGKSINVEINNDFLKSYIIPKSTPGSDNETPILYPAHLINFISQRYINNNLFDDLSIFIKNSMETILQNVSKLPDDKSLIGDGLFWLSNVFEIYSFIRSHVSNHDTCQQLNTMIGSTLINLFNVWMKKMISYVRYDINISSILLGSPSNIGKEGENEKKLTHLLVFFYEIMKFAERYKIEDDITHKIIHNILDFANALCVNDLCVKFYELSWKLGYQINKNMKALDDWLIKHHIDLDPREDMVQLRQIATFLQLRMDNLSDLKIAQEFCYHLNPIQLQTILKKYKPTKTEREISPEITNFLANVVKRNKGHSDSLTLKMTLHNFPNPIVDENANPMREVRVIDDSTAQDPAAVSHPSYTLPTVDQIVHIMSS